MKKLTTLLFFLTIALSFTVQARKVPVTTAATLRTAYSAAQDKDTILLMPGVYNTGTNLKLHKSGLVVIKSFYPDTLAILQGEIGVNTDTTSTVRPSLILENLHLQDRSNGVGQYIFACKNVFVNIDTLAFRNCEISKVGRSIFRSEQPSAYSPTYNANCGEIEWLEMSNCKIHDCNNSNSDSWAQIYCAHIPMYVSIINNTFYDIPYAKGILNFNHMENNTGRNAEIRLENNTI
ncbi:MAG: hypothetical protein LBN23_02485, partial [Paludibacter sp.]|nr:hypothetical protein [Paludibacter sp.]